VQHAQRMVFTTFEGIWFPHVPLDRLSKTLNSVTFLYASKSTKLDKYQEKLIKLARLMGFQAGT